MLYQEAEIKNNELVITQTKQIDQNKLTSDCWLIQFNGLSACESCEVRGTNDCGGSETLNKLINNEQ